MRISFKDGQTLQAQSVSVSSGVLHVNVIQNSNEQLKHLFTDEVATERITVEEDGKEPVVYENYTVFCYIKENYGGIFDVEMQQAGKDTDTRLSEVEEKTVQTESELMAAVAELTMIIGSLMEQLGGTENV